MAETKMAPLVLRHVNGVEVLPLHVKEHEFRNSPPTFPYPPFLSSMFKSRGSGKTTCMINMIRLYDSVRAFDHITIFSPTTQKDPKFAAFMESKPNAKLEFVDTYTDVKFSEITNQIDKDLAEYEKFKVALAAYKKFLKGGSITKLKPEELIELYAYDFSDPMNGSRFKHGRPSHMIVFDDMVGDKNVYRNDSSGLVGRFTFRHRHYNASMCFMAQSYKSGIPRQIRNNLSTVVFFANKSEKMKVEIAEEMSSFVSIEQFIQMWDYATEQPHGFLMVDFSARDPTCRFRSGFDQLMILSADEVKTAGTDKPATDETKTSETPPAEKGSGRSASLIHPEVPLRKLGVHGSKWATVPGSRTKRGGANTTGSANKRNTNKSRPKKCT